MDKNSNASPEVFGFDFQVNATIFLLLDNIKEVKAVRMEGASEDIELTMKSGNQIMAQAKGIVKGSSDFSNVRRNLKKAIKTLSSADSKSVEQLILITNSKNPLNENSSKSFFYGPPVAVGYNDLSDDAKKVIDNIVERLDVQFEKSKFQIYYFMFETDNLRTRYAIIEEKVKDFINQLNLGQILSAAELMNVWQNDLFHNRDMVVGASDSIDLLQTKKKLLISRLERVLKDIECLELEIKEEEQQNSLFSMESLADVFDRKMASIDINPVDVNRVIDNLKKERKELEDQISRFTNDSNDVTQAMIKTVQKYMEELGDSEAEKMTWKYLFTSNLKELSGAVLHKTVFSFRLAYIIEIERRLGIKLPILLDSPKGKEVDDINIGKMMRILQRDFPDNQIIIASIYHYVSNEHVIILEGQLLDKIISV